MKPLNSSSLNKALWIDIKAIAVSWIIVPLFQNVDTKQSHLKALPSRMPTAIQITRELVSGSWVNAKQIAYKIYVHISFRPIFVSPTWSTFCRLCFSIKMSPILIHLYFKAACDKWYCCLIRRRWFPHIMVIGGDLMLGFHSYWMAVSLNYRYICGGYLATQSFPCQMTTMTIIAL